MTTTEEKPSPVGRAIESVREGGTVVITVLAFVCAMIVGAVLIVIADEPTRAAMGYFFAYPWDAFAAGWEAVSSAYLALFQGSVLDFGSFTGESNVPILGPISDTLFNAAPLILGGLSVAVAFRAGLFNIGGQGQLIAGAICAGWVGFTWHLPVLLHLIVAMIAGLIGGAIWGGIAGWLKAQTGAHEVISTIMLNYIALYLLFYLLSVPGFQAEGSNQAISVPIACDRPLPAAVRVGAVGEREPDRRAARGAGLLVAAHALDARLPAARRRRQPVRRAHGRDERGGQLHHRHADRGGALRARRARRRPSAATTWRSPATSTPASASTRSPSRCWAGRAPAARCSPGSCSARCGRARCGCRPRPACRPRSCRSSSR